MDSDFKKATDKFNERIGADYMELDRDPKAQAIVKKKMDEETLRVKYSLGG